ncbi:MAG TPA: GDSL-type esterase/lipase family protein [Methanoregulaceae archaeon]|nr:GDSL-type esterase/lipase family protein [Methanoregulaceae archaeon]HQJ88001.1 GDSL-type esterase/lipase family protein [Methanoregulaceae archaeon]
MGDSITRGGMESDSAYPSYRYHLWTMLHNGGYDIDFVGSTSEPNFQRFVFDQDHDGHSGFTTEKLADEVDHLMMNYTPDIVLLYIGTNDVLQQIPMSTRMRSIDRIVGSIRQKNPNVKILIAQISPTGDTFRNEYAELPKFNQELLAYAQRATSVASPIVIVDMYSAWSTDLFNQEDGIHTSTEGELQLAQRWANALISTGMIQPSVPVTTPSPPPTIAPTTVPTQPTVVPTYQVTTVPTTTWPQVTPTAVSPRSGFGTRYWNTRSGTSGSGFFNSGPRVVPVVTPSSNRGSTPWNTDQGTQFSRPFQRWYPSSDRWS